MKRIAILPLLFLSACVSMQQILVDPSGHLMTCQAYGEGMIGATHATEIQNTCLDQARAAGYMEIERAGAVGLILGEDRTVLKLTPGGPAEVAGVQPGDRLVKVNGQPVGSRSDAHMVMFGPAGERVNLTMERGGTELEIGMVRAPYPQVHGTGTPQPEKRAAKKPTDPGWNPAP